MAIDPKDLGELQKALNEAAGKASVLWTTFITFQLYLAIAFGSVTHRDLFLENSIKLPLLNVDLPLVGFFVVAPAVLVILHFYVFLQLLGLAITAKDYGALLAIDVPDVSDRQYVRRRLDVFPILRFLAGPRDQRTGFFGFSLRLIAWIILVATPVLILLQAQVTFLPYHREWIVWVQRIAVLIDLVLIWYFWIHLRSDDDPINGVLRKAWMCLGGAGTLCVVIFSMDLALFPGEWVDEHLPDFYVPTTWRPHWSEKDDWTSLYALLFQGAVDEVSGRPRSVFSNRLVLTNQSFIVDPEKLDKITVSHFFRGRDLRLAVLNFADLRKADFTGAQLQGASLEGAQLQGASLNEAQLQGASLDEAQLQGASLNWARVWRAFGTPNLYLADLRNIDAHQKPWKDNETFGEWRDAIANRGWLRDDLIGQLAVLDPAGKNEPENLLDQGYWDRAHSSQPQGEEVRRNRAKFLADLACMGDSAPYVARGLFHNLMLKGDPELLDAGGLKLFTDQLLKGKSDPTTCPGVRDFTDTDWAELSELGSKTLIPR